MFAAKFEMESNNFSQKVQKVVRRDALEASMANSSRTNSLGLSTDVEEMST